MYILTLFFEINMYVYFFCYAVLFADIRRKIHYTNTSSHIKVLYDRTVTLYR